MKPLTPTAPHVIMLVGIPGAGKTTFAERFAKTFSAPYLNPRALSVQTGIAINQAEKVVDHLLPELFKTKQTIVYEGPAETKAERAELVQLAKKAGYHTLLVWVQTEPFEAGRRATKKQTNSVPLSVEEFKNAVEYFQVPLAAEKPIVISGRHTYTTQLKVVLKHLSKTARPSQSSTPEKHTPSSGRNIIIR